MKVKLTKSCSRCRLKKLKCNNNVPCQHCTEKGIEHECRKDVRQPRRKRAPTTASASELQAMKDRITQMEAQLNNGASSSDRQIGSRMDAGGDDVPSDEMDTEEDDKDVENAAELLEHFATSTAAEAEAASYRTKVLMPPYIRTRPNAHWSKPENRHQFDALKSEVRDDLLSLSAAARSEAVVTYAKLRASVGTGNVIHYITFIDLIEGFCDADPNVTIDADDVAAVCMVIASGLLFHPGDEPRYTARFEGRMDLGLQIAWKDGRLHSRLVQHARRALAADKMSLIGSLNGISAGIHLLVHAPVDDLSTQALEDQLIRSARYLGYDKLGNLPGLGFSDGATLETARNAELAVRTWHFLVARDWAQSQKTLYYRIMPDHFNTRPPLRLDDKDLLNLPFPPERTRLGRTTMSLTRERMLLADLVRRSVDLLPSGARTLHWSAANRAKLEEMYSDALANLPPFFSLEVEETNLGDRLRDMQRASLHQLYFDLLLKLHRSQLGRAALAPSVVMLANRILDIQGRVNSVCRIVDSLWLQQSLVFCACIVLVLELWADQPNPHTRTSSSTLMTRSRVRNAILLLNQNNPRVARGARLLNALLDEEQKRPVNNKPTPQSRRAGLRSAIRLAAAIDQDTRAFETQTTRADMAPYVLPRDLDLMPTLLFDTSEPSVFNYGAGSSPFTTDSTPSGSSNPYTPPEITDSTGQQLAMPLPATYDPTTEDVDALLWQWLSSGMTGAPAEAGQPTFVNNSVFPVQGKSNGALLQAPALA